MTWLREVENWQEDSEQQKQIAYSDEYASGSELFAVQQKLRHSKTPQIAILQQNPPVETSVFPCLTPDMLSSLEKQEECLPLSSTPRLTAQKTTQKDNKRTFSPQQTSLSDSARKDSLPSPIFIGLFSLTGEMVEGSFRTPTTLRKDPLQGRSHYILSGLSMLKCCDSLCDGDGSYLDLRSTWERWQFWKPLSSEFCVVAETGFYLSRSQYLLLAKDYFSSCQSLSSPSL